MNNKQITTINQNAKSALIKSKNLLDITRKILDKKELMKSFEFRHFLMEKGHLSPVNSVAISPDGKYIVSGSIDKTIKIWDIKTGECLKTLEGHSLSVESVAISLDGKYIVSGSRDTTIKIWDIKTGECLNTLEGHRYDVNSVTISQDGKYIVSGSYETIKIWDIKTGENNYTIDNTYNISIDNNGFFNASDYYIDKYLRISEEPLTQRKLTLEEINYFRKKDDFLEIEKRIIDKQQDEIPF